MKRGEGGREREREGEREREREGERGGGREREREGERGGREGERGREKVNVIDIVLEYGNYFMCKHFMLVNTNN